MASTCALLWALGSPELVLSPASWPEAIFAPKQTRTIWLVFQHLQKKFRQRNISCPWHLHIQLPLWYDKFYQLCRPRQRQQKKGLHSGLSLNLFVDSGRIENRVPFLGYDFTLDDFHMRFRFSNQSWLGPYQQNPKVLELLIDTQVFWGSLQWVLLEISRTTGMFVYSRHIQRMEAWHQSVLILWGCFS